MKEQDPRDLIDIPIVSEQRTEEWFQERVGHWTGSVFKDLMACNRKGTGLDWSIPEKVKMFSDGVLKFIFQKAFERRKGFSIRTKTTSSMAYGNKVEEWQIQRANEVLLKEGKMIITCGFDKHPTLPNTGVSCDGYLVWADTQEFIMPVEIKSPDSLNGYFDRVAEPMNEKHMDFWQLQGQMMTKGTEKALYIVASPPRDSWQIETYEDWVEECDQHLMYIERSYTHTEALEQRILIAEKCVNELGDSMNVKEVFYKVIDSEPQPRTLLVQNAKKAEKVLEELVIKTEPQKIKESIGLNVEPTQTIEPEDYGF